MQDTINIDDVHELEKICDFTAAKLFASNLVRSKSTMKPEKKIWILNSIEKSHSPVKLQSIFYNILLAGEGHFTIGTPWGTAPNSFAAANTRW
jgi:hypothetical protein